MRSFTIAALGLLAGLATAPAFAGNEINTAPGFTLVDGKPAPGLALHGYDVVAFFTDNKPVQGDAKFSMVDHEATYRFATQAHLDAFKANPAKYEPAFGGFCTFGVSVGAKLDGDPRYFKVVDGKLYVNVDENIFANFLKDVPGTIAKAEANWPKIANKAPADIK